MPRVTYLQTLYTCVRRYEILSADMRYPSVNIGTGQNLNYTTALSETHTSAALANVDTNQTPWHESASELYNSDYTDRVHNLQKQQITDKNSVV
jgi:hypothetical protein